MKFYITLHNSLYILDKLDSHQKELFEEFLSNFNRNPKWLDFANFWFNKLRSKYSVNEDQSVHKETNYLFQLPIFKIGQDFETRLGIDQKWVQKSFLGPGKYLYEDDDEVVDYFKKILEVDKSNATINHTLGYILMNKTKPEYKKAIAYLEEAVSKYPLYKQATLDLLNAYEHEKMNEKFNSFLKAVASINKEYAEQLTNEMNKINLLNTSVKEEILGATAFVLKAPRAKSVYVTGSFNDWSLDENCRMTKNNEGIWTVKMNLKPGIYKYQFIVDGKWREDPANPSSELTDTKKSSNLRINH